MHKLMDLYASSQTFSTTDVVAEWSNALDSNPSASSLLGGARSNRTHVDLSGFLNKFRLVGVGQWVGSACSCQPACWLSDIARRMTIRCVT